MVPVLEYDTVMDCITRTLVPQSKARFHCLVHETIWVLDTPSEHGPNAWGRGENRSRQKEIPGDGTHLNMPLS